VTSQQIRELAVDPVEQGRAQKKLLDLAGLALQHLGEQVFGHRTAAARDSATNLSGSGLLASDIAASRRPAAQPSARWCSRVTPASDSAMPEASRNSWVSALSKTQVCRANLGQLAGETELVQPEGQITPRREDRVHMLGELLQQPGQLRQRLRRGQLVQIIDDQEGAIAMVGELRQNSLANGRFIEVGCPRQLFAVAGRDRALPEGVEDGKPELLGVC